MTHASGFKSQRSEAPMKSIMLAVVAGLLAQQKGRLEQGPGPEVGKAAPAFKLKTQDGKEEVEIEKLKGRPALLVFGSWT